MYQAIYPVGKTYSAIILNLYWYNQCKNRAKAAWVRGEKGEETKKETVNLAQRKADTTLSRWSPTLNNTCLLRNNRGGGSTGHRMSTQASFLQFEWNFYLQHFFLNGYFLRVTQTMRDILALRLFRCVKHFKITKKQNIPRNICMYIITHLIYVRQCVLC